MSVETNGGKRRKVVLIVDDVSMSIISIKSVLSKYFDVRSAKSGELALYILGNTKVDLILLDVEMPGMSGFDFIHVVKNIPEVENIPIIFVTSHAKVSIISDAVRAGAKDFIVKPVNAKLLKEKVFKVLDMPVPRD